MVAADQIAKSILIILATVTFLFLYLRYIERRSLYIPFRQIDQTPQSVGLVYEDLNIRTPDQQVINAWYIPAGGASGPSERGDVLTLFFLHGNGGNLSHRLEKIVFFHQLGMDVFIIDYRGYGKSTGTPTESGLYTDAQSGYHFLTQVLKIPPDRIIVFGESLGGAIAVDLAKKTEIKALILEGVFTSVSEMSRRVYPFLPTIFLTSRYDSHSKIKDISIPKFFIHSRNDEVVPFEMGKRLFQQAQEPKAFIEIHGGHNEAFFLQEESIRGKIIEFLEGLK